MRTRLINLVAVGLLLVGCGTNPPNNRIESTDEGLIAVDALWGTYWTLAAADAPNGALFASVTVTEDGPRPLITSLENGKAVTSMVPSRIPLADLHIWPTSLGAAVLGTECPSMKARESPADLEWDEARLDNATFTCGGSGVQLWSWAGGDEWTHLDVDDLDSENGYATVNSAGDYALLFRRDDKSELVKVDGTTGETEVVPDQGEHRRSAETSSIVCLAASGDARLAVLWTGKPPSSLPGYESYARIVEDEDGTESGAAAFTLDGDSWSPVPISGTADTIDGSSANCAPFGIWSGSALGGAKLTSTESGVALSPLPPMPKGFSEHTLRGSLGSGSPILISQDAPDESPDAPRRTSAFNLDGGSWAPIAAPTVGTSFRPVVAGKSLIVLRTGGDHQVEVDVP